MTSHVCGGTPAAGTAQAAADAGTPLNEIIVTATRVAQPLDQALEPILVINRAELADSLAIDVGDVLRYHAGIDVGRSGGAGQPLSIFIRGTNSELTLVIIQPVDEK